MVDWKSTGFVEGTSHAGPRDMPRTTTSDRFIGGARIADYIVDREIAYDATAITYLATHVVLPRQAQLRVTHPGSRTAAVQLLREACLLEALSHAGIPRVHECGVLGDRRPWSAIELMPGVTFERFVGAGPLAMSDLVVMLRDVSDIVRHAHERGVVHRRLTAGAIIRTQRRRSGYAICEWGDACTLDTEAEVAVDPRDDVAALGAIAYRALTGHAAEGEVPAAAACPAAPAELSAVIDQMLAAPVARPTAAEVFDRALWLCDTLEVAPMFERPRWTPPQGYVAERVSSIDEDSRTGFAIRIGRVRTNDPG
jgi:serine/threonine-protein kinase